MNVNNIFIPMLILTNYDEYKKILKNSKEKLNKTNNRTEKNNMLIECKNEINIWHKKMIIKSCIILILFILFVFIMRLRFILTYNDYFISLLVIIYIICFILEKYRNKESIMDEIEAYASHIGFIEWDEIRIF